MIRGFQFSPEDGRYIGEYQFPNNLDQDDVHIPPHTTLEQPPPPKNGKIVKRQGDKWIYELIIEPQKNKRPQITNYSQIKQFYIDYLKASGEWSDADQINYEKSIIDLEFNDVTLGITSEDEDEY